jgi:hypothetical protein
VRPTRFPGLWNARHKLRTYLVSRLALSPSGLELTLEPYDLGVPPGSSKMISEPMVRSAQTVHLSCGKIDTISQWNETSFHLSLVTEGYHHQINF